MLFGCWFLLGISQESTPSSKIAAIQFEGIKKTKPSFLRRFIQSEEGQPYDSTLVQKDVQSLRNLQLFLSIKAEVTEDSQGVVLTFHLGEIVTIIPSLDFGGVQGNRYIQVGGVDFHFGGKGAFLGGFYRYNENEQHSFQLFYQEPYLKGSSWGYRASLTRFANLEPLFVNDGRVEFEYKNYYLEGLGRYEFAFGHFLYLGGGYLFETYKKAEPVPLANALPDEVEARKLLIKSSHNIQNLAFYNEFLSGFANTFQAELSIDLDEQYTFWKLFNTFRYFHRIGKSGNFATRLRVGASPQTESPIVPFILDSYENIRGTGNRVARGSKEMVWNVEYRHTLYHKDRLLSVQGVGFSDLGTWELQDAQLFESNASRIFWGVGLRLQVFRAYNFILRVDHGINALEPAERGWVLGVGQYF